MNRDLPDIERPARKSKHPENAPLPDTPALPVSKPLKPSPQLEARKIVLAYITCAGTWILFSDHIVGLLFPNRDTLTHLSMLKGLAFVAVTGFMLNVLIRRMGTRLQKAQELEEKYAQSQKLASIGRLAGGIAHDFNNILTTIFGNLDMATAQLDRSTIISSHLEECRVAAQRAAGLTRQLLACARRQTIEPRVVDLNELTANLLKMLQRLINEDIALMTELSPELEKVKVDPGQIEQVLMNLVINARDAMPRGGVLTIRTENRKVTERGELAPGEYVTVSIIDTGAGMTEDVKQHLFEPFFTTKPQGKGTGLGLATCFGIVQQCGGHITFESRLGSGTTFTIWLTKTTGLEVKELESEKKPDLEKGKGTILLVEDEPSVRELSATVLRRQGYLVIEASNGKDALALIQKRRGRINLLVTDVVMPEMGGKALADKLTAMHPDLKVMFISGYIEPEQTFEAVNQPGTHFLQKPFTQPELLGKVAQVLALPSQ